MEKPLEEQGKNEASLMAFHVEISELKVEEEKEGETAHFTNMNPQNLTQEDMEIWGEFKSGKITDQELVNWRHDINKDRKTRGDSDWLAQYIVSQLSGSIDVSTYLQEEGRSKKNNPSIFD